MSYPPHLADMETSAQLRALLPVPKLSFLPAILILVVTGLGQATPCLEQHHSHQLLKG